MNIILLYSSILTGIGCFIVSIALHQFYQEYWIFYLITTIGIITSILNHGTTIDITRNIDRMFMFIAFLFFISFINTYISGYYKMVDFALLSSMVLLYISSKLPDISQNISNILHTCAHFIFLLLFTMILFELPEKQENKIE